MAKKSKSSPVRSARDWHSGSPPAGQIARRIPTQPNSQPSYLNQSDLVGSVPSGTIPPPNPQQFQGDPGNLPGIAGGPPKMGTAPGTPPSITPPPVQDGQQVQGVGQPPAGGLPADGNLIGWTPTPPTGGPSPKTFQGDLGNLPGIAGGPPPLGTPPTPPPPLTLPPR